MGLDFTGTIRGASIPDSPSLTAPLVMSFSAWVFQAGAHINGSGVLYCKTGGFALPLFGPFWQIGAGLALPKKLAIFVSGTTPFGFRTGTDDVPDNVWAHVASTWDGAFARHYINGVLDSGSPMGPFGGASTDPGVFPSYLGYRGDLPGGFNFEGFGADLRYYNRVLSHEEIITIFTLRGKDNIINGLLGRWPMRGVVGASPVGVGSVMDLSENGNNGTPVGPPVYVDSPIMIARKLP